MSKDWVCLHCSFLNNAANTRCRVCNIKNNSLQTEIACPLCTLLNSSDSPACEACSYTFQPKDYKQANESKSNTSNSQTSENNDSEDSDCEERMFFQLVSEQIDNFIEEITQNNEVRYKCKFDGRVCGTKSIMCAYIARRHKSAVLEKLKNNETSVRESDEALAWKLAILDYKNTENNSDSDNETRVTNQKSSNYHRSVSLPTTPISRSSSSSSTSLPSSNSSSHPLPKSEPKKKKEYIPLPPSAYFHNRHNIEEFEHPTSRHSNPRPKVAFNLSEEDKETRLVKLLTKSEQIASRLAHLISTTPVVSNSNDNSSTNSLSVQSTDPPVTSSKNSSITTGPDYPYLEGCNLRTYQSAGIEWLCSLHEAGMNGILADEMGLGKTLQVITFFCCLLHRYNIRGPHLVVMPLSVLSSWKGDILKYCPTIKFYIHLGKKEERESQWRQWFSMLRSSHDKNIHICLTTYDMVIKDTSLFAQISEKRQSRRSSSERPVTWSYIVVDEAHRLKNSGSKLFLSLSELESCHHLLLTGTPLQNNLKELWSLLHFILPSVFTDFQEFNDWFNKPFDSLDEPTLPSRKKIVKRHNLLRSSSSSKSEELTEEEKALIVASLHKVLKPFILRRIKSDVATDLPTKIEKIIFCPLSELQLASYQSILTQIYKNQSTTTTKSTPSSTSTTSSSPSSSPSIPTETEKQLDILSLGKITNLNANNVVMQLRKICNHPYLTLEDCISIPDDLYYQYLLTSSGKLAILSSLLDYLIPAGHKVLIFCQMTTMLTILEGYLQQRGYPCYRLDGNTDRDTRDHLIREFSSGQRHVDVDVDNENENEEENENEDGSDNSTTKEEDEDVYDQKVVETASIFLLSTRAGGVGINLQCADTVILYDSDWNPQMDLQAIGRAHRIGQKNSVLILRLISVNHQLPSTTSQQESSDPIDPTKQFLSIEERMLIRATGKLEAEKAILARRQFDLSASSAEENLKNIMEVLNKLPKDESVSDSTSYFTCDEIVNLAQGSQLISYDQGVLKDICERRTVSSSLSSSSSTPTTSTTSPTIVESNEDNEKINPSESSSKDCSVTLMSPADLENWKPWFEPSSTEDNDNQVNLIYNEQGRAVRKNRSKAPLSESELWKKALEKAETNVEISSSRAGTPNRSEKKSTEASKKRRKKVQIERNNSEMKKNDLDDDPETCTICGEGYEEEQEMNEEREEEEQREEQREDKKPDDEKQVKETEDNTITNNSKKRGMKDTSPLNVLLLCDGCNLAFHPKCVGLNFVPKGDWFCQFCDHKPSSSSSSSLPESTTIKKEESVSKFKKSPHDDKKRKRVAGSLRYKIDEIEYNNDDIIILSDDDEEDEADVSPPSHLPHKKHKCSLCGHPVADFDDLQFHLVVDCIEWKKLNTNTSHAEIDTSYLPAALKHAYTTNSF